MRGGAWQEGDRVEELGEFGLIERLKGYQGKRGLGGLVVGIGDDAAVLEGRPGFFTLVTTDALVEGIHFHTGYTDPYDLGRKAMAVNLSDIAAMGGRPTYATVALGLSQGAAFGAIDRLYRGFFDELSEAGAQLVGGDTIRSPGGLLLHVTLLGEVETDAVVLRHGASPGDWLCVSGRLGEAAAGLDILRDPDAGSALPRPLAERLIARHRRPSPRLGLGRRLATEGIATAMADVSDGLAGDVGHLCRASRVGARLDADTLPIGDGVAEAAEAFGRSPLAYALHGGEDYELVFTCRPGSLPSDLEPEVTVVGEILPAEEGIVLVTPKGDEPLSAGGFTHF